MKLDKTSKHREQDLEFNKYNKRNENKWQIQIKI